jgi:hypothetical protein
MRILAPRGEATSTALSRLRCRNLQSTGNGGPAELLEEMLKTVLSVGNAGMGSYQYASPVSRKVVMLLSTGNVCLGEPATSTETEVKFTFYGA